MPDLTEQEFTADESYDDYDQTFRESIFGGPLNQFGHPGLTTEIVNDPTFEVIFDGPTVNPGLYKVDSVAAEIYYSDTGTLTFTAPAIAAKMNFLHAAIGPNGKIMCVGRNGRVIVSTNKGGSWQEKESGVVANLWSVVHTNTEFVATGENGTIITTDTGNSFEIEDPGTEKAILGIAYDKSQRTCVAVGENFTRLKRSRTKSWSVQR